MCKEQDSRLNRSRTSSLEKLENNSVLRLITARVFKFNNKVKKKDFMFIAFPQGVELSRMYS